MHGGFEDWRLPTTPGTGSGYSNEGEMGYLYYDEGITYSSSGFFDNVQNDHYWYGTLRNPGYPWGFNFDSGYQDYFESGDQYYAWAVRVGDVLVPIPGAVCLFGSGLVVVTASRRKFKR